MEIGNKIMELRKKMNLSQEELAEMVGVARQTISKWELGETSPDLKQSKKLSNIFNVSLDELVDNDIKDVLVEKTSNTEKLAGKTLKFIRLATIFIIFLPIVIITAHIVVKNYREKNSGRLMDTSIVCTLHGETYSYNFNYYEETGMIKSAGGDGYLVNIVGFNDTADAYMALDKIDAYVKNNGGTCQRSEAKIAQDN